MSLESVVQKLAAIGGKQAELLALPKVSNCDLIAKANEILIERESYECVMKGIITKEELANLILAHFHTLICQKAGADYPSKLPNMSDLESEIIEVVFEEC